MDKERNKPSLSVIVPIYNVESFLVDCIESILQQNYENMELILIDDGSTDKCIEIVDYYKDKYPSMIKAYHKKNNGLISARRAGLKLATMDYVCFVDADDRLDCEAFSLLENVIKEYAPDIIQYRCRVIDYRGRLVDVYSPQVFDEGLVQKDKYISEMVKSHYLNSLGLKVCRRRIIDIENDYSDYWDIQNGEDLLQSIAMVRNCQSIFYLNKALYYYRMNKKSITHTYNSNQFKSIDIVRPKLFELICELKLDDDATINSFYRYYANSVWEQIFLASRNGNNIDAYIEISGYEYVKKLERYYQHLNLDGQVKKGLTIFYNRQWQKLYRFCQYARFSIFLKSGSKKMLKMIKRSN